MGIHEDLERHLLQNHRGMQDIVISEKLQQLQQQASPLRRQAQLLDPAQAHFVFRNMSIQDILVSIDLRKMRAERQPKS